MVLDATWEIEPELGYLVHEHRELRQVLDGLPRVAQGASGHVRHDLILHLATIEAWLDEAVLPHMRWEERVFHPALERLADLEPTGVADRAEYERVALLAERLKGLRGSIQHEATPRQGKEARAIIEAIHRSLLAHVEREDRLIRSLLA